MASRDIGASIQAALKDLFAERAVVDDAIEKLQSLLQTMGASAKRRGRPPGSGKKSKAATGRGKKAARRGRPPGSGSAVKGRRGKKKTKGDGRKEWTPEARDKARERMRAYWAKRRGD